MLYFIHPPDAPFTALLALTHELATVGFRRRGTAQEYGEAFPTVAPWWSPKQMGREWRWLWGIHQRRQVYNVDDHHWALLFDALRFAITVANAGSGSGQLLSLGPIRVGVIDAELLIDAFFWHLRFLDKGFDPPAPGTRQAHRVTRAGAWMTFDPFALYRPDSTRYPDPRTPDETRLRRDGEAVSFQIPGLHEMLDARRQDFREKYGRDMEPGDPVFWDPKADTPTPVSEAKMSTMMEEVFAAAGLPAYGYAYRKLGYFVTEANLPSFSPEELRAWQAAVEEYERDHPHSGSSPHPRRPSATPTPHPNPPADTPTDEIVRGGLESLVYMARNLAGRPRAAAERDPTLAAFLGSPGLAWLPDAIRDRFVVAFGVMSEEAQLLDATGMDTTEVLDLLLDLLEAAAYVAVDCYAPDRVRADCLSPQALALLNEVRMAGFGQTLAGHHTDEDPAPPQWRYQVAWLPAQAQAAFPPLQQALTRWFRERLGAADTFARLDPLLAWWLFSALAVYADAYEPMTFTTIDAKGRPREWPPMD